MAQLTDIDKKLINILSRGIPIIPNPYQELAKEVGLTEEELLNKIKGYKREGLLRRFGATLRHVEAGFTANAMSVWVVAQNRVDEVGKLIASYKEVTHCYKRASYPEWPYNLYAMIHGKSKSDCEKVAFEISKRIGIDEYKLLYSTKEFKKTSMEYFKV